MADWFYSKSGQQLGPVSADALTQMALDGRVGPNDLVWRDGMAQWSKASTVPGLFPDAGGMPPAIPAYSPAAASANAPMHDATPAYVPTGGTSGLAITSLVLGLLICVPFAWIGALICGILGLGATRNGAKGGRGMAVAGLVLGIVSGLIYIVYFIAVGFALIPAVNRARASANHVQTMANERAIASAINMYQMNNHGHYPPDLATLYKSDPSMGPNIFVSPLSQDMPAATPDTLLAGGHCSYIYVGAGLSTQSNANLPVLYETPSDDPTGSAMLFVSGRVDFVLKSDPRYGQNVH